MRRPLRPSDKLNPMREPEQSRAPEAVEGGRPLIRSPGGRPTVRRPRTDRIPTPCKAKLLTGDKVSSCPFEAAMYRLDDLLGP